MMKFVKQQDWNCCVKHRGPSVAKKTRQDVTLDELYSKVLLKFKKKKGK